MRDRERQRRFDALLRENQRVVFKVAAVYARSPQDRDDLAQDIAMQLWRAFATYDARRAKFTTWMYRIALNVAISHLRSARREDAASVGPLDEVHLESVAGTAVPHDESLEHDQRVRVLNAFIAGLDPLNRALVLLHLEDRSYAEIADVLGISETNVATKLNRIKQKLRAQAAAVQTTGA